MAATAASCIILPCKPKRRPFSASSLLLPKTSNSRCAAVPLRRSSPAFTSLSFSSTPSLGLFPAEGFFLKASGFLGLVEKPRPRSSVVVCSTLSKKTISTLRRIRLNERQRMYNKAIANEIKTRMKKIFWCLHVLRKKNDPTPQDVLPIEELIAMAYSKIDKAVSKGVLHRNTANRRKSRLARRKKAIEILHGWYTPPPGAPPVPPRPVRQKARRSRRKGRRG